MKMNNITQRHLVAFLSVAEHESFTLAAQHLHLTQSTLTATIKQLESEAELKLFDRTTRKVQLSLNGEAFYPVAQKLVSDFDAAMKDLRATALQKQGEIKISASPSVLHTLLPDIIKTYRSAFPDVAICLREDHASAIESDVLNNRADFGFGGNHSNQPDLEYRPVLTDQYGIVSSPDYAKHLNADEFPCEQIDSSNLIMLTEDNGIRLEIEKHIKEARLPIHLPENLIEASTTSTLALLIQENMGISLLPALAASTNAFEGLSFLPLKDPFISRELCLIKRRGRSISPAGNELYQRTLNALADMKLPSSISVVDY